MVQDNDNNKHICQTYSENTVYKRDIWKEYMYKQDKILKWYRSTIMEWVND